MRLNIHCIFIHLYCMMMAALTAFMANGCLLMRTTTAIHIQVTYTTGQKARKTATIQLARDNLVYIFQLRYCCKDYEKGKLEPALEQLLKDDSIRKVGLNIKGDATKLKTDFNIKIAAITELNDLGKQVFPSERQNWSLQRLALWACRRHLSKNVAHRFCDWEAQQLSQEEVAYAAADAAAGLQIYRSLSAPKKPEPPPTSMQAKIAAAPDVDAQVEEFLAAWGSTQSDVSKLAEFPHQFTAMVKLDPFHLLQRYGRCLNSKADPLFGVFMSMMRDALFCTNKDDEKLLREYLIHTRQASKDQVDKMPRSYFVRNCRRSIPPPAILAARLQNVFELFRDATMANGKPLYRQHTKGMNTLACCPFSYM